MKYVNKTTNNGKVVKLKNYKKRAKINKIKRKLLLIFLILFAISIVLMYAPFMKIKSINCYNNNKISTEDIIAASHIYKGGNIFRTNIGKASELICDIPYVKSVRIKRKLPSTINIDVTESNVFAYIIDKKSFVYIDDTAKILEISDVPPQVQCPVISGVNITKQDIGESVEFKNEKQITAFMDLAAVINESDFKDTVTIINLKNLNDIRITVNNNLEIIIGNIDNLDYKINFLASGAYSNIGGNKKGTLNVSYGTNAVFKELQ